MQEQQIQCAFILSHFVLYIYIYIIYIYICVCVYNLNTITKYIDFISKKNSNDYTYTNLYKLRSILINIK